MRLLLSEKQILKGCQNGDKKCQRELVLRYSKMLMAASLRYVKDESSAKDVLQEGFIRIFKNIHKYKPIGPFENWMRRIVVRCALTHLHKNKILQEIEWVEYQANLVVEPDVFSSLGFEEINRFVMELPLGYQTVFNLNVVEGFSHREIGDLLNISESASRSQLTRAKKILREKIIFHNSQKRASI